MRINKVFHGLDTIACRKRVYSEISNGSDIPEVVQTNHPGIYSSPFHYEVVLQEHIIDDVMKELFFMTHEHGKYIVFFDFDELNFESQRKFRQIMEHESSCIYITAKFIDHVHPTIRSRFIAIHVEIEEPVSTQTTICKYFDTILSSNSLNTDTVRRLFEIAHFDLLVKRRLMTLPCTPVGMSSLARCISTNTLESRPFIITSISTNNNTQTKSQA